MTRPEPKHRVGDRVRFGRDAYVVDGIEWSEATRTSPRGWRVAAQKVSGSGRVTAPEDHFRGAKR